jgi:hypothetical protein
MKVLVLSDIHNDVENIMNYIDKLSLMDVDIVVAVGDFIDYNVPKGFTKVDIAKLILEELNTFKKPIMVVPGNFDKELIEFFDEKKVGLHGTGRAFQDVGFYGFGGAKTPFNTPLEPSEKEIEEGLKKGFEKVKNCKIKIQITHIPPARTKLDVAYTGAHIGSEVVRKFIEENKPDVAVSAHVHEARGVDELKKTKLINPGRFPEGYCGMITIKNSTVKAEVISLI